MNLAKPLDTDAMIAETREEDCYTQLWKPDDKLCAMCAANVVCGILYNARLKTVVADIEKEKGGYLGSNYFDCIDPSDLKIWLGMKPRTKEQFVSKIAKFSNCPDMETVEFWCKSFVMDNDDVAIRKGYVVVI